nr:immunoglobulin light chain junction region [Macaca mulatta]
DYYCAIWHSSGGLF